MNDLAPPASGSVSTLQARGLDTQDRLVTAIYSTIAYRDVFEFPLDAQEVHRFLHHMRCDPQTVADVLMNMVQRSDLLCTDGTYFALRGREHSFAQRHEREALSAANWQSALVLAGRLSTVPFIRMVALTGSVAARNMADRDDIDVMCITDSGRMWRVRALVLVLQKIAAKVSGTRLCPNYFVSTKALSLKEQNMYVAQELAQMVPVYGFETYHALREANSWTQTFLPNADGPPGWTPRQEARAQPLVRRPLEWIGGSILGDWVEKFECARKTKRFNKTRVVGRGDSKYTPEATGHRQAVGSKITFAWLERLRRFEAAETLSATEITTHNGGGDPQCALIGTASFGRWPLLCPDCRGALAARSRFALHCASCGETRGLTGGVVDLMPRAKDAELQEFLGSYQHIRDKQGYTGRPSEYYRALPWVPEDDPAAVIWKMRRASYLKLRQVLSGTVPAGAMILDLGSGNGWLSNRLSDECYNVLAADINMDPEDGLATMGRYKVAWPSICSSFQSLPLRENSVDVAVFNGSFHYGDDPGVTLREAARVVKPGGSIYIMDTPIYNLAKSGEQMVAERDAAYQAEYGYLPSRKHGARFLTWAQIAELGDSNALLLETHRPTYSLRWRAKRHVQQLRGFREPADFALVRYRVPAQQ